MKMQYNGGRNWDPSQLRANGDMSRLVDFGALDAPNGIAQMTRTEGGYNCIVSYGPPGYMIPGDDGRLYTTMGATLESNPNFGGNFNQPHFNPHNNSPWKMSDRVKGPKTLVPALGGQFYIAVSREGGLTLYNTNVTEALVPLDKFPGWDPVKADGRFQNFVFNTPDGQQVRADDLGPGAVGEAQSPLTLDRRICFAPALDHILFVPHSNDQIVQRKFDLKAALEATGEDYLMVLSSPPTRAKGGAAWAYQLKSVAKNGPLKYELSKGPEGMAVSTDGKVTWTAPKGIIGRAPVEIKGIDTKGKVVQQEFEIGFE
jgi:hypothetical protein